MRQSRLLLQAPAINLNNLKHLAKTFSIITKIKNENLAKFVLRLSDIFQQFKQIVTTYISNYKQ